MTWFQQLDVFFAEMMELRKMIDQQGICGWPAYDKMSFQTKIMNNESLHTKLVSCRTPELHKYLGI